MKKLLFFTLFLFLSVWQLSAVEFSRLSKTEPVVLKHTATNKTYIDFLLDVQVSSQQTTNLFLNIKYIIDGDTLDDYLFVDESYEGVVKQAFLPAGESITALLYLHNANIEVMENVEGNFRVDENTSFESVGNFGENKFVGSIWDIEQSPLFRISKDAAREEKLQLVIGFTENFAYDQLFLKIKIISPTQGILNIEKAVEVYDQGVLPYQKKKVVVNFPEVDVTQAGSYYLQVSHQMAKDHVNGVDYIKYNLAEK